MPEDYQTTTELARKLGLTRQAVCNLCALKKLPGVIMIGGRFAIPRIKGIGKKRTKVGRPRMVEA